MADETAPTDPGVPEAFAGFATSPPETDVARAAVPEGFEGFQAEAPSEVSTEEAVGTYGQSVARGFVKTTPPVAGVIAGFQLGMLGGPAAPFTAPAGALIGGYAGLMFGDEANRQLEDVFGFSVTGKPIEEVEPNLRPFAVAGEATGGAIGPIGGLQSLVRQGVRLTKSFVGNYINRIMDTAARSPGTFAVVEGASAITSGIVGGAAEVVAPGNIPARITGEVLGGMLNPVNRTINLFNGSRRVVNAAFASVNPATQTSNAAKLLQQIVEDAGEDPILLARLLDNAGITDTAQTAAQKTGSPALAALEAQLSTINGKFSVEARELGDATLEALDGMIAVLRGTGDPGAMAAAAQLRSNKFKLLLTGRVDAAERELAEAAARITDDTPANIEALSVKSREVLGLALEDARKVETELWDQVDKALPVGNTNTVSMIHAMKGDMLPEESLPGIIEGFLKRQESITKKLAEGVELDPDEALTVGELTLIRSRSLALAREAQVAGKFSDARVYGNVAEAVLDDLDVLFKSPNAGAMRALGIKTEAYEKATSFSKELNDTFKRTFAGHALAKGTKGDRLPPELMLERALAAGGTKGAVQLRELEEATRFLDDLGFKQSDEMASLSDAMIEAQERLIRLAAADAINPLTKRIDAKRLATFIKKHDILMRRFPEVRKDLKAAVGSQVKLDAVVRSVTHASKVIDQGAAFAKVTKFENSVDAVSTAAKGGNPVRELVKLSKLAKGGGEEAVQGLRTSIVDHALIESASTSGMSFRRFRDALFAPVRPGQDSIIDVMKREGIFNDADINQLTKLLDEADKVQGTFITSGRGDEGLLGDANLIADFVQRVIGSKFATSATAAIGAGGQNSILIASAGSRGFRKIMDKVPRSKTKELLIAASTDSDLMKILLTKAVAPSDKFKLAKRLHSYLLQAGLFETGLVELPDIEANIEVGP